MVLLSEEVRLSMAVSPRDFVPSVNLIIRLPDYDGTARRVPGKGPGTGSGRVERRAAVLPGFVYFVSIHTVPPVPRGPVGKVYRDVPEAYQTLPKCIPKVQLAKTLQNSSESEACKDHATSMDHLRKFCAKKRAQIMYGPCKPHFLHWFAKSLRSVFLG